jgi:hypothetical protein
MPTLLIPCGKRILLGETLPVWKLVDEFSSFTLEGERPSFAICR